MNAKADDRHDVIVVASDIARMAPTVDELSRLARSSRAANAPAATPPDVRVRPLEPTVDTTFRPTAAGDVQPKDMRRSFGRRIIRTSLVALVLAIGTGTAGALWTVYGDDAKLMMAEWMPLFARSAAPAVDEAKASEPAQVAAQAPVAPETTAANAAPQAADASPSLAAMTNDVAGMRQEIEQLKASIEELKASQREMSRNFANVPAAMPAAARPTEPRAAEPSARPRTAPTSRPAATQTRRPPPPSRPSQQSVVYPPSPQPIAPYVPPRQAEPPTQTIAEPLPDPELASVPRPPMPVR